MASELTQEQIATFIRQCGDIQYLAEVKWIDRQTGQSVPFDIRPLLGGEFRIWSPAYDEKDAAKTTILFSSLDLNKFAQLARRWNRSDSPCRFEISFTEVDASAAATFVVSATHRNLDVVEPTLRRWEQRRRSFAVKPRN